MQRGLVDDPTNPRFFAFPSLAVNKNDDVLLGYSRFQGDEYAGASYSFRTAIDPPNFMQSESPLKDGVVLLLQGLLQPEEPLGRLQRDRRGPDRRQEDVDDPGVRGVLREAGRYDDDLWGTWWGMLDPTPAISIADVSRARGRLRHDPRFTFALTPIPLATSQTVTVDWATANGTATIADGDYVAAQRVRHLHPGRDDATSKSRSMAT